jgi:HD-GYP domain-containing protein (c-di-GMP phosphodiesterase class II)
VRFGTLYRRRTGTLGTRSTARCRQVQQDGISAEILDAIRHHHEYLDGSGYPDGLSSNSISDLVRVFTISDIFAALIEHRPYRQPMQRGDAYEVLCGIHDKLEKALVRAFKPVALAR